MNQNLSPIQFKHTDNENTTSGYHRVSAISGGKEIGRIDWDGNETGRVNMVHVNEDLRRQGIATSLWNEAHNVSTREGLVGPVHDTELSGDGSAWSKSVK